MNQTLEEISFQMILHAGNARSSAMEAIQSAKTGDFEAANKKIRDADKEFTQSHRFQTELLTKEAKGEVQSPSILLIHAQDHLMTAMSVKEMAQEMIELYQRLEEEK
ncbi:PTS lactose/cellobiose transporter subunit IIA [Shouchella shacheensis]|uniref:PTS lactose/cellobiose transporter subunit IIA n=1 Tax=Shouchella shacheensis TaxID=1649580 RepID=UPI00073FF380|nr:PTS lactose/cellobiose transporter subunit IIA [Shouchella shacheensis]